MGATSHQRALFEDYDGFVEKFKPKKTTDDCYTPANIYEVVAEYVAKTYGVRREDMVRPFWPGGDYERFDYPAGCCVVDNPPFSIETAILREYQRRGLRFFLFCPYLTAGSYCKIPGVTVIVAPAAIRYENGAVIASGFVTNMEPENMVRGDPDLFDALEAANKENLRAAKKSLPVYSYPDEVLTISRVGWFVSHHTPYQLKRADCCVIPALDAQRQFGKTIFGSGLLLSERAAAERAAAERAAAVKWSLSERERQMQRMLGQC